MNMITNSLPIPAIETHPFEVRLTDLNTGNDTYEFFQTKDQSFNRVKGIDEDNQFAASWDRINQELLAMSHDSIDGVLVPVFTTVEEIIPNTVEPIPNVAVPVVTNPEPLPTILAVESFA